MDIARLGEGKQESGPERPGLGLPAGGFAVCDLEAIRV